MKRVWTAVLLAAVLMLSGCQKRDPIGEFGPAEDRRLTVYSCQPQSVSDPIVREFEARTGIWVEVVTGTQEALLKRLEEGACDVFFGGDARAADGSLFTPYDSPELRCVTAALPNGFLPFSCRPLVLIYNTKLVRRNPPEGWESLVSPAWKGKIAFADPAEEGCRAMCTLIQALDWEPGQTVKTLYGNLEGAVLADFEEVVSAVAEGRHYIGIVPEDYALKAVDEGWDLALVYPAEGTGLQPDGAAMVKNCPHGDNARAFLDFLLSEDVQRLLEQSLYRRPVRQGLGSFEPVRLLEDTCQSREDCLAWWDQAREEALP